MSSDLGTELSRMEDKESMRLLESLPVIASVDRLTNTILEQLLSPTMYDLLVIAYIGG